MQPLLLPDSNVVHCASILSEAMVTLQLLQEPWKGQSCGMSGEISGQGAAAQSNHSPCWKHHEPVAKKSPWRDAYTVQRTGQLCSISIRVSVADNA